MVRSVTVRVPATTANLGPGFDCLGMAVDLWNRITVRVADSVSVSVRGEGEEHLPHGPENLVYRSLQAFFRRAGLEMPHLHVTCVNQIPLARGLGSSASAIVGGLLAGNLLAGEPLAPPELLRLAVELEGHPDNVAPALLGGLQVVVRDGDDYLAVPLPVPSGLGVVVLVPDFFVPTDEARRVLPEAYGRAEVVHNLGRVSLLVASLATGRLEHLRRATQDVVHQPHRQALVPLMPAVFRSALEAGALGVFLSGSGPTIVALTHGEEAQVARAMLETATAEGHSAQVFVTSPSIAGAHFTEIER